VGIFSPRIFQIDGQHFDAGISPPGGPVPAEAQKRKPTDERMELLSSLFMDHLGDDSENKRLCGRFIVERSELNKTIDAFIEKLRQPMREKLIELHEQAKTAVREQQEKVAALQNRIGEAQAQLNVAKGRVAEAMTALNDARQRRKEVSRFAPRKEIAAADEAIENAIAKVDKANAAPANLQAQINYWTFVDREPLVKELNALMAEELELRAAITGESYTDEYGLVHPPRSPIV
jgi:chromosome segregation ATPase